MAMPQARFLSIIGPVAVVLFSLFSVAFLTEHYFPIEPDVANSPLVWRMFLSEGFTAFKDWRPTPDNWYFTTYPINFLFFALSGSDGPGVLALATSLFISLSALILYFVMSSVQKKLPTLCVVLCLTLLPAHVYIFGYAAHPFSHYSTNFFGILVFALCFINLTRQSIPLACFTCILAMLASVSDPWFQATYFLPLLIVNVYFSQKKIIRPAITITLAIGFISTLSNLALLQRLLGLPLQRFRIAPPEQWITNTSQVVDNLGNCLNLFFIHTPFTASLSFFLWAAIFLYAVVTAIKTGTKNGLYIGLFSFLTVSGILSSFILSYQFPQGATGARFFSNAICFGIFATAFGLSLTRHRLLMLIFPLYLASSLYSYSEQHDTPLNQAVKTEEYMTFLQQHDLKFGYSDYWHMSNTVNWLSYGKMHITPIMFDDQRQRVEFDRARPQSMKSWLSPEWLNAAPERQFFVLPLIETSTPADQQLKAITTQIGEPDEIIPFQHLMILVYHHRISVH
ncbi:MAG: hypothetical protein XXXJIFNMEKO3_02795 [Candidatus Erwinia impunctatus]|nr:hypothetical protein XXXJIFNMEKO_02795 [Culicoides impunctatus]